MYKVNHSRRRKRKYPFRCPRELILPTSAINNVITGAALDNIGGVIADNHIIARTADGIFNGDARRDGNIALQTADIGKRSGGQVDALILRITREIKRILAAPIPYRENQLLAAVIRRIEVSAGIGMESINAIPDAGAGIGAIQILNRGDIVNQRRSGIMAAVIAAGVGFIPIAHHAELASVFGIGWN